MNRFSSALLLGSGVLVLSLTAWGQRPYNPPRDDPYYRNDPNRGYNDDRSYRGDDRNGYGGNEDALIGRVLSDLNRAAAGARLDGHERKHFNEVAQKLQEFEGRLAQGRFDTGKLDSAINNLEHLARADRVRGRDRDMLARDVQDLRQLRYTRGGYSNYGYGDDRNDRYYDNRRYSPNGRF